jgi:hypothetical protein
MGPMVSGGLMSEPLNKGLRYCEATKVSGRNALTTNRLPGCAGTRRS